MDAAHDPLAALARSKLAPEATLLPSDALPALRERDGDLSAAIAIFPARHGPLMPFLMALRDALRPDATAALVDLVWQTAPTPELLRAFAPAAGREKVRPIEGYEMHLEHAGFHIRAREDVPRDALAATLTADQAAALAADARGAARVVLWTLAPSEE